MVDSVWPYLGVLLLAAGIFPALESRFGWRIFSVLPAIVWTYLLVMALAVAGFWSPTPDMQAAQRLLMGQLLPALLFLLMVTCDLRAILAVGPRVLAVFACAMLTILGGIMLVYLAFRHLLPADGWKMLAALAATWTGGSANLVAVNQSSGCPKARCRAVLLADALCYSTWVLVLFSTGALAPAFNRWTRADSRPYPEVAPAAAPRAITPGGVLLWLGIALLVGTGAARLAAALPASTLLTPTSWTVLIATVAGLVVARTPLATTPGPRRSRARCSRASSRRSLRRATSRGLAPAPLFVLCGFVALADPRRRCSRWPRGCSASTCTSAASPRWRRSAALRRRRCWPRRTRRCWCPSPCCSRCSAWCSAPAVGLFMAGVPRNARASAG